MRFFHLSDLHIGKQLYGYSLLEDQEWILEKILQKVEERKPDGFPLSGYPLSLKLCHPRSALLAFARVEVGIEQCKIFSVFVEHLIDKY